MTHTEIVTKLIGPIDPIGETNEDARRFENLRETCALIQELLHEVNSVSRNTNRAEHSLYKAGKFAKEFIETLKINF